MSCTPGSDGMVPCELYVSHEELLGCCSEITNPDPASTERARKAASELLFYATGQQYPGCCITTLRPVFSCGGCNDTNLFYDYGGAPFSPALVNGRILNIGCGNGCPCSTDCMIDLDQGIRDVSAVFIDGEQLPATDFELYANRFLRLINSTNGGSGVVECWPSCNVPKRAIPCPGETGGAGSIFEGTWAIVASVGNPVPKILEQAAAALACHFQQLCPADSGCAVCKVPRNATSVTKGGATYQLLDPRLIMDNFALSQGSIRTGLFEVDLAIKTLNPYGYSRMASVYSPDVAEIHKSW